MLRFSFSFNLTPNSKNPPPWWLLPAVAFLVLSVLGGLGWLIGRIPAVLTGQ